MVRATYQRTQNTHPNLGSKPHHSLVPNHTLFLALALALAFTPPLFLTGKRLGQLPEKLYDDLVGRHDHQAGIAILGHSSQS